MNTSLSNPGKYESGTMCYLDPQRCQHIDGSVTYDLLLTVRWLQRVGSEKYLDVSTRESLTLAIDGRSVCLWPRGDVGRERDRLSHYVTDSSTYPVSVDILRKIAEAHEVDVTISSDAGTLEGYFEDHNMASFRRFWQEYGSPTDPSDAPRI